MRKKLKLYALYTAIYALCSTCAYAGTAEIKNETDNPIKVFVRVHSQGNSYETPAIHGHDSTALIIDKSLLGLQNDKFFYDIIASSSLESTIEPDWRLLAGECDNLFSGDDVMVIIQTVAAGLKTTCKVLKKQ